jgi:hypothetical protein
MGFFDRLSKHHESPDLVTLWKAAALFGFFTTVTVLWYGFFPYHTIAGDDLRLVMNADRDGVAASLWNALTKEELGKYRPVVHALFAWEVRAFGAEYRSYVHVNMAVQVLNACLAAIIAFHAARRSWWIALLAGTTLLTSRLAYYCALVVYGLMEGLSVFFLLTVIGTVLLAYRKKDYRYFWGSLAAYSLLVYTHERYISIAPFLILSVLLGWRTFGAPARCVSCVGGVLAIVLSNVLIKSLLLQSPFLLGTDGKPIEFDLGRFTDFFGRCLANILGFNLGPDYLSGLDLSHAGLRGVCSGVAYSAVLLVGAAAYGWQQFKNKAYVPMAKQVVLLASLLLPLAAVTAVTSYQEPRWFYAPYVVSLMAAASAIVRIESRYYLRQMLVGALLLTSLNLDSFYREHVGNCYFLSQMRISDYVKTHVIDHYGPRELNNNEVFLITGKDPAIRDWILYQDDFFRLYTSARNLHVNYVGELTDIPPGSLDLARSLFFLVDQAKQVDITLRARSILGARGTSPPRRTVFDFKENIGQGEINKGEEVQTPNKRGVFAMDWPTELGPSNALTILTGFTYAYPALEVQAKYELVLTAAIPLPGSDGARAFVEATSEGAPVRVVESDLPAPVNAENLRWISIRKPLADFAGRRVRFKVGVESPSGDGNADWVAFAELRLDTPDH